LTFHENARVVERKEEEEEEEIQSKMYKRLLLLLLLLLLYARLVERLASEGIGCSIRCIMLFLCTEES